MVKACKGEKKEEKTVEGLHHTELGGSKTRTVFFTYQRDLIREPINIPAVILMASSPRFGFAQARALCGFAPTKVLDVVLYIRRYICMFYFSLWLRRSSFVVRGTV
ncbi:hypothetical protein OOU_Y34scaffold00766g20 [Pyricularia oryzae Y34]|uniref:Uncharacterized protein n=1 Tax=Pyricularia oryzae (strain Y34) TaxID=1143189 RepID=A0AA97PH42_PYRO3|nr:hypothetical protein OOU_Y34scaffold00766g20 [Pyricularia oryzae Y34]